MTCDRSAGDDGSQFAGRRVVELADILSKLGPIAAWAALMAMIGGAWVTVALGQKELRRGQAVTNRRIGALAKRLRRLEIRMGPEGGPGGR
jgi:hypothetical protein